MQTLYVRKYYGLVTVTPGEMDEGKYGQALKVLCDGWMHKGAAVSGDCRGSPSFNKPLDFCGRIISTARSRTWQVTFLLTEECLRKHDICAAISENLIESSEKKRTLIHRNSTKARMSEKS